jgi:hypothetical protein
MSILPSRFALRAAHLIAVTSFSLCMLHGVQSSAQEAAYVDTRDSPARRIPPKGDGADDALAKETCGENCKLQDPLILQLVKLDLGPQLIEWTVRVGNQSQHTLRLPSSVIKSGLALESSPGHKVFFNLSITASLACASREGTQRFPLEINLYGSPDGSAGISTLDPGQWMTIVGRADVCDNPGNDRDSYSFNAKVSLLDSYRKDNKDVEDVLPIYQSSSSGLVHWDGHGELASGRSSVKTRSPRMGLMALTILGEAGVQASSPNDTTFAARAASLAKRVD